ncbi:AAA family ATPase, partial [Actinoplanes sp. NPDC049596]
MLPDGIALRGRDELLATIEARLATGGGIALHGPAGIGKTALLEAVAGAAEGRGELVVRLRPVRSERSLPYAGISDLVNHLPPEAAAGLPAAQRAALAALRQGLPPRAGGPALARRLVLPLMLAHAARCRPVLLVLDDCQWLDAESAELIAFAMRRRPGPRVRAITAQRRPAASPPPHQTAPSRPEPAGPRQEVPSRPEAAEPHQIAFGGIGAAGPSQGVPSRPAAAALRQALSGQAEAAGRRRAVPGRAQAAEP